MKPRPRLLVSVRDVDEARRAAAGGADIIDFKDPARGPLGRAAPEAIARAAEVLQACGSLSPLSAALGEVSELDSQATSEMSRLPESVEFLKLGLAGFDQSPDWIARWLDVRRAVELAVPHPVRWVAVAYADVTAAGAPPIAEVINAAARTECAGLLIDTYDKSGGRLLDHLSPARLKEFGTSVRDRDMFLALAGRLRKSDIPTLRQSMPDIVAVRSMVCRNEQRTSGVCEAQVAGVRRQLGATFSEPARPSGPAPIASPPASASRPAG